MTVQDIKFEPHSDMSVYNVELVKQHQNFIKNDNWSDATSLLNNQGYDEGFRASLLNNMQNKLRMVQEYLLSKEDECSDEIYSDEEPIDSDVSFWIVDY